MSVDISTISHRRTIVAITDDAGALEKSLQAVVNSPVVAEDGVETSSILHTLFSTASKPSFLGLLNPSQLHCNSLITQTVIFANFSLFSKSISDLPRTDNGKPSAPDKTGSLFLSVKILLVASVTVDTSTPVSITKSGYVSSTLTFCSMLSYPGYI